jgi:hypothetical protein
MLRVHLEAMGPCEECPILIKLTAKGFTESEDLCHLFIYLFIYSGECPLGIRGKKLINWVFWK